jgi:hypothetical protein
MVMTLVVGGPEEIRFQRSFNKYLVPVFPQLYENTLHDLFRRLGLLHIPRGEAAEAYIIPPEEKLIGIHIPLLQQRPQILFAVIFGQRHERKLRCTEDMLTAAIFEIIRKNKNF